MDLRRESDVDQLRRIALAQEVQIKQLLRVLESQCRELEVLKGSKKELQQTLALLETLTKQAQAARDAATDAGDTDGATDTGDTDGASTPAPTRKTRTTHGPTPQLNLTPETEIFELDEADRVCPSCGGDLHAMSGQFETSELVDSIEVSYRLVQVKQQKYVCRCGGCVETAPGPERVTPGSRYSLNFAIKVALDKYLDHIPLARQVRILHRHDVKVTTQTLWGLLLALARRCESHDRALLARALADPVIGLDQTSWKRLDDKKKKPWQMWCVTAPGVVVHRIRKNKGADTFRELVGHYEGVIVCDAAKTHEAGARDSKGIRLAGCWAHAYRKFEEAAPDHPEAHLALAWIADLYAIDARAGDDAAMRAELRRTEFFHPLPSLSNADVADLLDTICIRVLALLEREGVIADRRDPRLADDGFAEREPALAALSSAAVTGNMPAGPEARQRAPIRLQSDGSSRSVSGLSARQCGFSLHAATTAPAQDARARETLCKYDPWKSPTGDVLRPPLAEQRVKKLPSGLLRVELKRAFSDGTVAIDLDPLSLLCRLAAAVPPPRAHLVRYAGVLSAAHRWRERIVPPPPEVDSKDSKDEACEHAHPLIDAELEPSPEPKPLTKPPTHRSGYRPWRELLRRTFQVDLERCAQCGARLVLRALITAAESVARFLRNIGEDPNPPPIAPARAPPFFRMPALRRSNAELHGGTSAQTEMFGV